MGEKRSETQSEEKRMPKKGNTDEQIMAALQQAETGEKAADICRKMSISQATFYTW